MKMKEEEEEASTQTNTLTLALAKINMDEEEHVSSSRNSKVFPSFSSLPVEMMLKCLAHIPKSYYPKLSLVSTRFHSLISSTELGLARQNLKARENVLYVCLQLRGRRRPSWFSLWLKPDQILTNDIEEKNTSRGNTMLVSVPSQYSPRVPKLLFSSGFKSCLVHQDNNPPTSSLMHVRDMRMDYPAWRYAPRMKVARANPITCILDGKIYIIGGCKEHESRHWAEVFDTKTQTWESLPDPGRELRFSLLKEAYTREGKVYVRSSEKNDYFYDTKESRWGVVEGVPPDRLCVIAGIIYTCTEHQCCWYNTKLKEWRVVKGLEVLDKNRCASALTIANFGGKLLILWDKFEKPDQCQNKNIWCSVIALERRNGDDQVWGNVEWASVVLTVPSSYVFLHCQVVEV